MAEYQSFTDLGIDEGLFDLAPVDNLTPPPGETVHEITGIDRPQLHNHGTTFTMKGLTP